VRGLLAFAVVVSQYRALARELNAAFPGQLEISGAPGRSSSFEITIMRSGGADAASAKQQQLFSKLHSGSFPDPQGVRNAVEQYLKDGTVAPIEAAQGGGCSLQ
jgi:selT/selW/selH-like putative selenoprotein